MHGMFWCPDKTTDASTRSRSGMTYAPSTANLGVALLTWYRADSRVRTSLVPDVAQVSAALAADSGKKWRELLVRFDPLTSGWKTHRCLFQEDLDWSSLTLPRWGSLHSGELWEQCTPAHLTAVNESGSWEATYPTPNTMDATGTGRMNPNANVKKWGGVNSLGGMAATAMWPKQTPSGNWPTPTCADAFTDKLKSSQQKEGSMHSVNLSQAVRMWPTPQAHKITQSGEITNRDGTLWDGKSKPHSKTSGRPITTALADAVKFATPQSRDFRTGQKSRWDNPEKTRNLNDQIGGQLNPNWVEWLMGWPVGWTDCAASATAKFRLWWNSHGKPSA